MASPPDHRRPLRPRSHHRRSLSLSSRAKWSASGTQSRDLRVTTPDFPIYEYPIQARKEPAFYRKKSSSPSFSCFLIFPEISRRRARSEMACISLVLACLLAEHNSLPPLARSPVRRDDRMRPAFRILVIHRRKITGHFLARFLHLHKKDGLSASFANRHGFPLSAIRAGPDERTGEAVARPAASVWKSGGHLSRWFRALYRRGCRPSRPGLLSAGRVRAAYDPAVVCTIFGRRKKIGASSRALHAQLPAHCCQSFHQNRG